jgi:L-amino acid N-acyltransferase
MVNCTYQEHAEAILAIFNETILNSTALYDYKPRSIENMIHWFKVKQENQFPVVGLVDNQNNLLGFASYGTFRAWPAYKYSVEHSIYIHKDYRGKGLGRTLLEKLIMLATEQNYHVMVGGIDMTNLGSIALHEKLGFVHSGTIRQAGFKFGSWLDLGFFQLILPTPHNPVDD